jgi:hypothetical protein
MEFQFKVLQAGHGDCILIQGNFDGQPRNILVDGGPSKTYQYGVFPGALKKELQKIEQNGQRIDLLILSHIDDDHIGGLLCGFRNKGPLQRLTDKVWFNSGKLIFEHFKKSFDASNLVYINGNNSVVGEDVFSSVSQGVDFESLIEEHDIWDRKLIVAGQEIVEFGVKFKILSPTEKKLQRLLTEWKRKSPDSLTTSKKSDYDEKFDSILLNDHFEEDRSKSNGSSIAFIFEYNEKKLLLLGDAHNEVIVKSLMDLGHHDKKPLECDYVKLSHHGSKKNTSYELLNLLKCQNFIFSSNTDIHKLPNKTTIARIAKYQPEATLLFNYPNIIEDYIFKNDLESLGVLKAQGLKLIGCVEPIQV